MYKKLIASNRCRLFDEIASKVWHKIKRAHKHKLNLSEIGITAEILVDIAEYNANDGKKVKNVDVYAKPGYNEKFNGSDIDVFVETDVDRYRWFALQAKLLKHNNRFDTLRDNSDGVMQWEKLARLEATSGCKPYYLLYNGHNIFTHIERGGCKGNYTEVDLGCSLVEIGDIKNLGLKRNGSTGKYVNPTFQDIHPQKAQPWSILTCCLHDKKSSTLYSSAEILGSNRIFRPIEEAGIDEDIIENQEMSFEDAGNPILIASQEANWDPGLRLVIKRSVDNEEST